ncbi:hypothetical protein E2562_030777 [Oryza meyeriana var. granulata]|uniref:Uncharacterized protein n=1 Tax=Oryza meyeriana var. granulata TaxID=110450 RepID=A0A6G1C8W3_9ORYZ|nr:hypothetical protein E2562_030777 [Oryza meyeriana var. granulata]
MWRRQIALLRRIPPLNPPAASGIGCYYATTAPEGRKAKTAPLQVVMVAMAASVFGAPGQIAKASLMRSILFLDFLLFGNIILC